MTDPLFVLGEGQFIIESAENFFILPVFSQPIFALNLYDTNNTLIPNGSNGVIYPNILQGENLRFTGLTAGTAYRVQGIAIDNNTRSFLYEISPIAGLIRTVTTTPPADPNLSDVYDVTTTTCYVTWDVGTNTDTSIGYYLATIFEPGTSLATLTTSPQQITGLLPSNTYNFIVVAQNLSGERTQSGNNQQNTLPADVTDLSVDASFNVTWTDTQNVQKRYDVQLLDSSDTQIGSTLTGKLSGFKLTNLPGNTNCKVKVLVRSELSGLYSDGVTSSSFLTLPTAPTLNSINNITKSQCNVNWTSPVETGVNYEIYTQNSDGTNQNFLIGATPSPQTISGLETATLYYFIVKAGNESGSVQSSSVSFTTLSNPSITAIFPTTAKNTGTNVIIRITLKNANRTTNIDEPANSISVSGNDGSNPTVTYTSGGGYRCSVTSATEAVVTYTISHTNFVSTSGSITWNTGGGGGGSGGGGENNGGNEHNNMSGTTGTISGVNNQPTPAGAAPAVNLFYKTTFDADASQELSVTVLGETTTPTTPDEVIVQYVDLEALNSVMSYTGTWSAGQGPTGGAGEQPTPDILVDFTPLLVVAGDEAEMDAVFRKKFETGDSGCGTDDSNPLMRDYSGDASLWPLQTYFTKASFTYSAVSTPSSIGASHLNSIPAEAVKNVEISDLECHTLVRAVNGLADAVKQKKYLPGDTLQQDASVLQLFEQAAAAGKIDEATNGTQFIQGDSITLYVKYTMTRTKKFLLDTDVVPGDTAAFTPLGLTTEIANEEELVSEPIDVIVAWQFVGRNSKGGVPSQLPA